MKFRSRPLRFISFLYIFTLSFISCDVFESDTIQPENQVELTTTTLYTIPGKALILDIKSLIKESYVNASVTINKVPTRGSFIRVEPLLYKYIPDAYFTEGQDQFELAIMSNDKLIKTELITIQSRTSVQDLPCGFYAIEDYVLVKPSEAVAVNILDNDRICNVNASDLQISIQTQPKSGQAEVLDNTVINYTPAPGFAGRDEVIYKVSLPDNTVLGYGLLALSDRTREDDPVISPGMISLDGWLMKEYNLPVSNNSYGKPLIFIDENTGFLGTELGLFKTSDGGEHWNLIYPFEGSNAYVNSINFSNIYNGYVSFNSGNPIWSGKLIYTNDGGNSWSKINFGFDQSDFAYTNSVYFHSETTGFAGGNTCEGYWDLDYDGKILKTEDGGTSWKEVLSLRYHDVGKIEFANEQVGYAFVYEWDPLADGGYKTSKLFITNDGGDSWQLLLSESDNYFNSYTLHPDNSLYVASEPIYGGFARISSIRKFPQLNDESSFTQVAHFPFAITSLKFSPSGNLGIAAGIEGKSHDVTSHKLGMSISFDKGATWLEVNPLKRFTGFINTGVVTVLSDRMVYFCVDNKLIKFWKP